MQAIMENPEDRIAGVLHDEEMIEERFRAAEQTSAQLRQPTLLEMIEEGIKATQKSLAQLEEMHDFLLDNQENQLPPLVRQSLRNAMIQIYQGCLRFNSMM